jgi:uncharacterized protein
MTPEERQLLSGLFDRTRTAGSQPRDREAESFIGDAVRQQPFAPYLLAQTVIVQEQALRAANERLQQLEGRLQELEGGQAQGQGGNEGFLGSIGRSIFGSNAQPNRPPAPQAGYNQQGYGQGQPQYQQPQAAGPWGQAAQQAPAAGGGFLKGALGMAAGVAGGALLGNAISGLFHGSNNPFGIASGMGGMGGFAGGGGETIVNNYYGDDARPDGGIDSASYDDGGFDNVSDGGDDGGFSDDDSYNV